MFRRIRRSRRRRGPYLGRIEFNEKRVRRWIRDHGGFASKEFLEGEVRYRSWIPIRNRRNWYRVFTHVVEAGVKVVTVVIEFAHYPNGDASHPYQYVYINRSHVKRSKK